VGWGEICKQIIRNVIGGRMETANSLRNDMSIRATDIRDALGVAPSTFTEIITKNDIKYIEESQGTSRGHAKSLNWTEIRKLLQVRGFHYPSPAKVITFAMQKGGVGKTTSTFFTSQRIAGYGSKVLVIDADPQGNLTNAFHLEDEGIEIDENTPILADVLDQNRKDKVSIEDAIIPIYDNLHLLPSTPTNSIIDSIIEAQYPNPAKTLTKIIDPLKAKYDYIIIDSAPAINKLLAGIVYASDLIIIPVNPDKFSEMGLGQTMDQIALIKKEFEGCRAVPKIVFTRYDAREFTSMKYLAEIASKYKDQMFETPIRTASDLKNAISKKEDLFAYKTSNAREDYDRLTREIMGLNEVFSKKRRDN